MIDIHSHLLPGVDDGAESMEEACMMARLAWDTGTKGLVLTPHGNIPGGFVNPWSREMLNRVEAFRGALAALGIPLKIMTGMEVYGSDDVAERIREGTVLTLNGSRYILMEFSPGDRSGRVQRVLEDVAALGLVPVIAHAERYAFVQENLGLAEQWAARGWPVQVNKGSVLGSFGRRAWKAAHALLADRIADVVASDSHSPFERTPVLADVYEHIAEKYSRSYAERLLRVTPGRIVANG